MIIIDNKQISEINKPYIIAELSGNHNGSLDRAKLSIKTANECGVDAVKIQTYNADAMTIKCNKSDFIIKEGLWKDYKLYELYEEAHTPYEWHSELFRYANELGITLFSTPFDENSVELLESLNTPAYKIASFELTDLDLISYVAKKGKPMLMSTGMSSESEISEAIEAAKISGCKSLLLLHCISSYPAPIDQANLRQIKKLKKEFGIPIGLSDHTIGNTTAITSIALGACAIEKHFTLNRDEKGPDSEFSSEPNELMELVRDTKYAWEALGQEGFNRPMSESGNKIFRRSIYFVKDLKAGEIIKSSDIRRIRPGFGLAPKLFEKIIGMRVNQDVERGDAVNWNIINK